MYYNNLSLHVIFKLFMLIMLIQNIQFWTILYISKIIYSTRNRICADKIVKASLISNFWAF